MREKERGERERGEVLHSYSTDRFYFHLTEELVIEIEPRSFEV